jgi:hypothetical protein
MNMLQILSKKESPFPLERGEVMYQRYSPQINI